MKPVPLTLKKITNIYWIKTDNNIFYIIYIQYFTGFRIVPHLFGTIFVTLALLILDRKAIKEVNYPLLGTFCAFFVFSGNMARIPAVNTFFSNVLPVNTLLFGILSCQFMSNVPSAVLLSHFTTDYKSLLPAVNIGGCGTLIASLASLITFSEYKKHNPESVKSYLLKFTVINFSFVIILYLVQSYVNKFLL